MNQIVVVRAVTPFSLVTSISEGDFPRLQNLVLCVIEPLKYDDLDLLVG